MERIRIYAFSMPAALAFSLILLVVSCIVTLTFSGHLYSINRLEEIDTGNNIIHAFLLKYSSDNSIQLTSDYQKIPINDQSDLCVEARKSIHGLYEKIYVKYKIPSGGELNSIWLLGYSNLPYECGLYVPDNGGIMTFDTDCRFQSTIMIPRGMYKSNSTFTAEKHVQSYEVAHSSRDFPQVKIECISEIKSFLEKNVQDHFVLSDKTTSIDTIIIAKSVLVDSSFNASIQIIALDSVIVTSGAHLRYPSGILTVSPNGKIHLEDDTVVEGYIIAMPADSMNVSTSIQYIQESKSKVRGIVYAGSKSQIEGIICGTIYSRCPVVVNDCGESQYRIKNLKQVENNTFAYPAIFSDSLKRRIIKKIDSHEI